MTLSRRTGFWSTLRAGAAIFSLGAVTLGLASAPAQAPGTAGPNAVKPADALSFMLGEWEGTGWAYGPNGQRGDFAVTESITARAGGYGVTFEGHGTTSMGPDQEPMTVHDAFALIWADRSGGFGMRTVVMQGHTLDVVPEIGPNSIVWGFDAGPMGEMRYTSMIEDGVWHEVGERRMGDEDWAVFLEMTLTRVE